MRIYIAGTFQDQKRLREISMAVWSAGHEITGTWLHETARHEGMSQAEFTRKLAMKDIAEVYAADLIILDNAQSSGGKNVEWGVALGSFQKKLLWLVGEPSNVFHHLADKTFPSWESVLVELEIY